MSSRTDRATLTMPTRWPDIRRKCRSLRLLVKRVALSPIDRLLALSDDLLLRKEEVKKFRYPVLFILGPPRCGSTLALQIAVASLRVAYFNNLVMTFPRGIVSAGRWLGAKHVAYDAAFTSSFGESRGWGAPVEGGRFWRHWFPRSNDDVYAPVTPHDVRTLRAIIAKYEQIYDGPFVGKYLAHSLNVRMIAEIYPESRFVVIWRNPLNVANSIIRTRMYERGRKDHWVSIRPPGYRETLDQFYVKQVAFQIGATYTAIAEGRETLDANRVVDVDYEEMCRDPAQYVSALQQCLTNDGFDRCQSKATVTMPPFEIKNSITLDDVELRQFHVEFAKWPVLTARFPTLVEPTWDRKN